MSPGKRDPAGRSAPSGVGAGQDEASADGLLHALALRTGADVGPPGRGSPQTRGLQIATGIHGPESPGCRGAVTCVLNPRPLPSDGHEETSLGEKGPERGKLAGFAGGGRGPRRKNVGRLWEPDKALVPHVPCRR